MAIFFSLILSWKRENKLSQVQAPAERAVVECGKRFCETAKQPIQKLAVLNLGAAIGFGWIVEGGILGYLAKPYNFTS
jgi:hypothetical protein